MNKEKTSVERPIQLAGGILGALSGVFAAVNSLSEEVKESLGIFVGLDDWQLWAVVAGSLGFGVWLISLSRRRRSVLLRPETLRLERANPVHLVGRAEDIDQLAQQCRERRLVFLEGESGAGKSALLQAGLVPKLKSSPELLPIYIESLVGADWDREPRHFLDGALRSALSDADRTALGLKAVTRPENVCSVIKDIRRALGRTPLLIVDQFDDYQTHYRERFLHRKTWLEPSKLAAQNSFWRELRPLVEIGTIHLLVVTRTDTAGGLNSVRFVEPEIYRLDCLESHFVGELLDTLAKGNDGEPVVADPEFGWTRLRSRLATDLERDGKVLPQQLKIVLAGLGTLPRRELTVAAYERAGGVPGLEARFIEDRLRKVARHIGLTEERLRTALLTLVDPGTGKKTVEQRSGELARQIDSASSEMPEAALAQLAREEVLRRRTDPGTNKSSWVLDHDYLARAVREADRRANRWQRALTEGTRSLADAGESWVRWWRALLPPGTQLGFLRDRLLDRFHYGEHRSYALKSLSRLGPYVIAAVIFPLFVGYPLYQVWVRDRPWGILTSVVTGAGYDLSDDAAIIGRPDSAVRHFDRQVELFAPPVSRIHLLITRSSQAIDLRSSYGTTLNGKFLRYGDVQQLRNENILVLAGEAAFRFSELAYWPSQFLTGPSGDVELTRRNGWGLLIDGQHGRITPLIQPEEFLVLDANGNIVTSKHSKEAIAVVRFRDLRGMELRGMDTNFTLAPTQVPYGASDQRRVAQCALAVAAAAWKHLSPPPYREPPRASATDSGDAHGGAAITDYLRGLKTDWLSIESLDASAEVTADAKMTDYDYGTFRLFKGHEIFGLTGIGDRNLSYVTQWLLHFKEKNFQVILRSPAIERDPRKPWMEVRQERRAPTACLTPDRPDGSPVARLVGSG